MAAVAYGGSCSLRATEAVSSACPCGLNKAKKAQPHFRVMNSAAQGHSTTALITTLFASCPVRDPLSKFPSCSAEFIIFVFQSSFKAATSSDVGPWPNSPSQRLRYSLWVARASSKMGMILPELLHPSLTV